MSVTVIHPNNKNPASIQRQKCLGGAVGPAPHVEGPGGVTAMPGSGPGQAAADRPVLAVHRAVALELAPLSCRLGAPGKHSDAWRKETLPLAAA